MTPLIDDLSSMIHLMQQHHVPGPYLMKAPLSYARMLASEINVDASSIEPGDEVDIRINGRIEVTVLAH